jgi:hypothetical protein
MSVTPSRPALEILAGAKLASWDIIRILESVRGDSKEKALKAIKYELPVSTSEALAVYEYLQSEGGKERVAFVEISWDDVEYIAWGESPTPGNPFLWRTKYFARRGMRVGLVYPYLGKDGRRNLMIEAESYHPSWFDQIWKIVPEEAQA